MAMILSSVEASTTMLSYSSSVIVLIADQIIRDSTGFDAWRHCCCCIIMSIAATVVSASCYHSRFGVAATDSCMPPQPKLWIRAAACPPSRCPRREQRWILGTTYSLHCSSFWGLPFGILHIKLAKPQKKKGTTMETIGLCWGDQGNSFNLGPSELLMLGREGRVSILARSTSQTCGAAGMQHFRLGASP